MLKDLETRDISRIEECRCRFCVHVNQKTIFGHQKVKITRTRFCAIETYRAFRVNFSGSMMRTPLKRVKPLQTDESQEMQRYLILFVPSDKAVLEAEVLKKQEMVIGRQETKGILKVFKNELTNFPAKMHNF